MSIETSSLLLTSAILSLSTSYSIATLILSVESSFPGGRSLAARRGEDPRVPGGPPQGVRGQGQGREEQAHAVLQRGVQGTS